MDQDEDLSLSASTLSALKEFMNEKDARLKRFEELQSAAEDDRRERAEALSMDEFEADWNQSQFWYDDATSALLAEEISRGASEDTTIGFVSSPSAFVKLKSMMKNGAAPKCRLRLLEYDERFQLFEEFTLYDYNFPLKLPAELKGQFDRILVDPPFLSDECQTKAALTVRWLLKAWDPSSSQNGDVRVMVCTGERMQELVERVYKGIGVRCTNLDVKHAQGLSNEFRCYASFESERTKWVMKGNNSSSADGQGEPSE